MKELIMAGIIGISALTAEGVPAKLLDAICQVESKNRADAVGDGGLAIGAYQIHKAYWADSMRIMGKDWPYSEAYNVHKARQAVNAYLTHYGRYYEKKTGQKATCEVLARMHNGGLNGWKKQATKSYWDKVKKHL